MKLDLPAFDAGWTMGLGAGGDGLTEDPADWLAAVVLVRREFFAGRSEGADACAAAERVASAEGTPGRFCPSPPFGEESRRRAPDHFKGARA